MVKRLESSFYAFKQSLRTLLRITTDMIKMFQENKVIIAPDLKVKDLQAKDMELDQIIEYAVAKGYVAEDILFPSEAFQPGFLEMLCHDKEILKQLNADWEKEKADPKFDLFAQRLQRELLDTKINPSGKLVLFSESVDTLTYLYGRITQELGRKDVLMVTAANRNRLGQTIKENFDANWPTDTGKYNLLLTSDVLAEGVNLHRANVIVNYDSPWNATRLMQRIGRVNRIGSSAPHIYNYLFYPSRQGDKEIQLYKNALVKLQGFHSAFGEDARFIPVKKLSDSSHYSTATSKTILTKKSCSYGKSGEIYRNNRRLLPQNQILANEKPCATRNR